MSCWERERQSVLVIYLLVNTKCWYDSRQSVKSESFTPFFCFFFNMNLLDYTSQLILTAPKFLTQCTEFHLLSDHIRKMVTAVQTGTKPAKLKKSQPGTPGEIFCKIISLTYHLWVKLVTEKGHTIWQDMARRKELELRSVKTGSFGCAKIRHKVWGGYILGEINSEPC